MGLIRALRLGIDLKRDGLLCDSWWEVILFVRDQSLNLYWSVEAIDPEKGYAALDNVVLVPSPNLRRLQRLGFCRRVPR